MCRRERRKRSSRSLRKKRCRTRRSIFCCRSKRISRHTRRTLSRVADTKRARRKALLLTRNKSQLIRLACLRLSCLSKAKICRLSKMTLTSTTPVTRSSQRSYWPTWRSMFQLHLWFCITMLRFLARIITRETHSIHSKWMLRMSRFQMTRIPKEMVSHWQRVSGKMAA